MVALDRLAISPQTILYRNQARTFKYLLHYSPAVSEFPMIVGVGGNITALNSTTTLNPNQDFTFEQQVLVNSAYTPGKYFIRKTGAIEVFISGVGTALGTCKITVVLDPGGAALTRTINNVSQGLRLINVTADSVANTFTLQVDGSTNTTALGAVAFPSNANGWEFVSGNSATYMLTNEIIIGGAPRLYWNPTTMVDPTNVPDASGNGNIGIIHWGTNPAGITYTIGPVTPYNVYSVPGLSETAPVVLPPPQGLELFENITVTGAGMPHEAAFTNASISLGWSVPITYSVFMVIAATAIGFGGLVGTGSIWGFILGFGLTAAAAGTTKIVPPWIAMFGVAFAIFAIFMWKRS